MKNYFIILLLAFASIQLAAQNAPVNSRAFRPGPRGTLKGTDAAATVGDIYPEIKPSGLPTYLINDLVNVDGVIYRNESGSVLTTSPPGTGWEDINKTILDSLETTTGNSILRVGIPSPETTNPDRVFEIELSNRLALSIEDRTGINGFNRSQNVIFNKDVNSIEGGEANWVAGGSSGAGNLMFGNGTLNRLNAIYGGYLDTMTNCLASSLVHTMRSSATNTTHSSILAGSSNKMLEADYSFIGAGSNNFMNAADFSTITSGNENEVIGPYNFMGATLEGLINGNGSSVLSGDNFSVAGNSNVAGRIVNTDITGAGNAIGFATATNVTGSGNFLGYSNNVDISDDYVYSNVAFYSKSDGRLSSFNGVGAYARRGGDARAAGYFDEIGDSQVIRFVGSQAVGPGSNGDLRMVNTPFSPTIKSTRIEMRDSTVTTLISQVTARNEDGLKSAGYVVKAVIAKSNGVITVKSSSTEAIYEDVSSWDVRIEKVDNNSIYIRCFGDTTDVTRWFGETTLTELKWN